MTVATLERVREQGLVGGTALPRIMGFLFEMACFGAVVESSKPCPCLSASRTVWHDLGLQVKSLALRVKFLVFASRVKS